MKSCLSIIKAQYYFTLKTSLLFFSFFSFFNILHLEAAQTFTKQCLEKQKPKDCLICNCYFEASGESFDGKVQITKTVLARVESEQYPDSVCKVVYQKAQFSWTGDEYPNVIKFEKTTSPVKSSSDNSQKSEKQQKEKKSTPMSKKQKQALDQKLKKTKKSSTKKDEEEKKKKQKPIKDKVKKAKKTQVLVDRKPDSNAEAYQDCVDSVRIALEEGSNGAIYYYNPRKANPKWARKVKYCDRLGEHVFLVEKDQECPKVLGSERIAKPKPKKKNKDSKTQKPQIKNTKTQNSKNQSTKGSR